MIFHLLEQVGLALRNIWLHDQLAGNHEMMTDVLRELSSACIVVGRDLKVLHANKAARRHFGRKNQRTGELEFSDLPQVLGAKIYQVLKTGAAMGPFRYEPENSPGTIYNISVVPFQRGNSTVPVSALLTADDLTQTEQLRQLEVEAANLRLDQVHGRPPGARNRQRHGAALHAPAVARGKIQGHGIPRIARPRARRRRQARHAAASTRCVSSRAKATRKQQAFPVGKLIEEAYQEARKHQPPKTPQLQCENSGKPIIITGDRAALKHALSEIMLNALQANPEERRPWTCACTPIPAATAGTICEIEVQDNGTGFTAEAAQKVPSPFFTTRNVGLGLGLTVSRKIIETHHGKLEIVPPQAGQHGIVRILLPIDSSPTTAS